MTRISDCVFGDWFFNWADSPWGAYRSSDITPLVWRPDGTLTPARMSETFLETAQGVALTAHWAQAHQEMLEAILGEPVTVDVYPRTSQLP